MKLQPLPKRENRWFAVILVLVLMVALRALIVPARRATPPILPSLPAETLRDGAFDGQFYHNRFFHFTIPIPSDWRPLSADELTEGDAQMVQTVRQLESTGSEGPNQTVHSHQIFAIRRKSAHPSDVSPALVIVAEPDAGAGAEEYVKLVTRRLEQVPNVTIRTNAPYVFNAKKGAFHSTDIHFSRAEESGITSFLAVARKGYVLAAVLNAPDTGTLAELKQIVAGMEF